MYNGVDVTGKTFYLEICSKENSNDDINGHELYLRLLSEGIKRADQCNVVNRPIQVTICSVHDGGITVN